MTSAPLTRIIIASVLALTGCLAVTPSLAQETAASTWSWPPQSGKNPYQWFAEFLKQSQWDKSLPPPPPQTPESMRASLRVDLSIVTVGPDQRVESYTNHHSEVDTDGANRYGDFHKSSFAVRFLSKDLIRAWGAIQVNNKFYVIPAQTLESGQTKTVVLSGGGKISLSAVIRPQTSDETWLTEARIRSEAAKNEALKRDPNTPMAPYEVQVPVNVW